MKKSLFVKEVERTNNLNRYFEEIKKYDLISAEEEVELIVKAQEGDQAAMDKLVMSHQRYIFSYARQYSNGHNVTDLVNEASEGFMEAIKRFDVTRGNRLCSYANYWMQQALNKYLLTVHLPIRKSNIDKTYSKVNKIKNQFFLTNGRYPTTEEIINELEENYGMKIRNKEDIYDLTVNSINSSLDEGETFYEESAEFNKATATVNEYEKTAQDDYNKTLVETLLQCLSEKEKKIIKPLFGIGCPEMDMDAIADEMGMSRERVRQLKNSICKKMRSRYDSLNKRHAI